MIPIPEHEADKEMIGDLLTALLEELDIEFLIQDIILQYIEIGQSAGRNRAMKAFRQWVRQLN